MAVLCLGATLAGLPAATAAAGVPGGERGCPVLAVARGVQVTVNQENNLVVESPTGPGVPVAQACVDYNVRESLAFASSPYPGAFLVGAPGLMRGPVGNVSKDVANAVPDYPAYVGTRYPAQQESKVDQPGLRLEARSAEVSSAARAVSAVEQESGPRSGMLTTAESVVDPGAGTAAATATADVQPFTVAGVLGLGQVESVASAKLSGAGRVERSSRLRIGRTTVAGQEVEITPGGVRAVGQSVALPDTESVEQQLAQAGVTVRFVEEEATPEGVMSAGVEITMVTADAGPETTVRYLVGRSFAAVAPFERGGGGVPDPGVGSGGAGVSGPVAASGGGGPVASGAAPAAAEVPVAAGSPAAGPPAPAVAGEGAVGPVLLAGRPVDLGLGAVYLVLVFGAAAMFAAGTLVRLLGVKTRWTS